MNIVLQNTRTLDFVKDTGGWTADQDHARVFPTGLEAIFFCLNHRIFNMQIVGEFADPRMDFTVGVTDLHGD